MDTAPHDGTAILAFWFDGCGWDCVVTWWVGISTYPWATDHNGYPEDKFDYWQPISYPREVWP